MKPAKPLTADRLVTDIELGFGQSPGADDDSCASTRIDYDDLHRLFKGDNRVLVPKLLTLVMSLEEWWPMTLRQIFYQAVAQLLISNSHPQYRRLGSILTTLREQDILPYYAMEDRGRRTTDKRGLSGLQEFLKENLEGALNWRYYHRCHLQGQDTYVEVTVEKDALATLVEDVVWPLCTRMSVTKGQPSVTLVEQIAGRLDAAMQRGQRPVLIHFGDLDPTGVQIPLSMREKLWTVHGLDVEVVMGGLTPEQCETHNLPRSLDAAKKTDPNIKRWHERFPGQAPTELDALHPRKLQKLVEKTVLAHYDDDLMEEQRAAEKKDEAVLKSMRAVMIACLRKKFPAVLRGVSWK